MAARLKEKYHSEIKQGLLKDLGLTNVMLVDSEGNKTRVGYHVAEGKKTRIARTNGVAIEEKTTSKK